MKLMRDESFGPIIGIQRVRDDDEAVALMNDNAYGLTAGVYTTEREAREEDPRRASKPAASTGTAATASARACRGRASRTRESG